MVTPAAPLPALLPATIIKSQSLSNLALQLFMPGWGLPLLA
jgi:hypothetical protein